MASKKPGKRPAQKKPAAKSAEPESAAQGKTVEPKPARKKSPEVKAAVRVTRKNVKAVKPTKTPRSQSKSVESEQMLSASEAAAMSMQADSPAVADVLEPAAAAGPPQFARQVTHDEIRHLAYLKWEAAGRPHGDGGHFWWEAERELMQES